MKNWADSYIANGAVTGTPEMDPKVWATSADSTLMANQELQAVLTALNQEAIDLEYRLSILLAMAESGSVVPMPRAAGEVMSSSAALAAVEFDLARESKELAARLGARQGTPLRELARMMGDEGTEILAQAETLHSRLGSVVEMRDALGRVCAERIERLRESMQLLGVQNGTTYGNTGRVKASLAPLINEAV